MAIASATSAYLLRSAWQIVIVGCLLAVLLLGLRKLASRGPTRMNNAVIITGYLIVAVALIGAIAAKIG